MAGEPSLINRFSFSFPRQPDNAEDVQRWIADFEKEFEEYIIRITSNLSNTIKLPEYEKTLLPRPSPPSQFVSMLDGGVYIPVYSTGTEWRKVADGGPI